MELNGINRLLVYADSVNVLGENVSIIKRRRKFFRMLVKKLIWN